MTQKSNRCLFALAAVFAVGAGFSERATAQSLVGDTVEFWVQPQLSGIPTFEDSALVVTPGHEFAQFILNNQINTVNIEATSIRLDSTSSFFSPYWNSGFDPSYFEFRDLDFVGQPNEYIVGVNVSFSTTIGVHPDTPANWPNFSASNVTFGPDSVRISIGGYRFPTGSFV